MIYMKKNNNTQTAKGMPVLGTLALAGLTACAGGDKKQEAAAPEKPMNIQIGRAHV